jgi:TonB family protein
MDAVLQARLAYCLTVSKSSAKDCGMRVAQTTGWLMLALSAASLSAGAAGSDRQKADVPKSDWGGAIPLPFKAQDNGDLPKEHGTVAVTFAIDSKGRVGDCTVVQTSGHEVLDSTACRMLTRYMRFRPARNEFGKPEATRGSTSITF